MKVKLLLFASVRELLGASQLLLELPSDASVSLMIQTLAALYPGVQDSLQQINVAINKVYVKNWDTIIKESDEIGIIPPISGG